MKWTKERKRRGGEERHSTKGVSPSADGASLPMPRACGYGIDDCASYRFGEPAITGVEVGRLLDVAIELAGIAPKMYNETRRLDVHEVELCGASTGQTQS
jgi:hypothetical protein